ncbi:hypothetical protein RHSIM_Rhsim13G0040500 [Rhododendron simsii]|uniref:UDENN domain-containing protein n=1 Tax=Rhododendron simsii TaxID=118357 RepID=A0A834L7C3_RHOSS|nr:hypothetical protein RHSIM_Rhsim13G0040500 [Rhododendron simsii]
MESKENGDGTEEWPTSPYQVLQQISEEAFRAAGEAIQSVYLGSSLNNQLPGLEPGHRRCQSEVLTGAEHRRSNSFQRWKSQMQRALRWGNNPREQGRCLAFNPEVLANQKRQWYQLHSKASDQEKYKEPTSLFEHFIIVGIHPDANLEIVEDAFAKRKKWELDMKQYEMTDLELLQHRGASFSTMEPQILFKYPPGKRLAVRPKDLAAFCFPGGVKARLLERTPSLSDLNEVVYGQKHIMVLWGLRCDILMDLQIEEHLCRDDLSFIFSLKFQHVKCCSRTLCKFCSCSILDVASSMLFCLRQHEVAAEVTVCAYVQVADNATLYGVCLLVQEIVQRPPAILGPASPISQFSGGLARFLVSAPRCYCVLTRVPFFELHYEMLNSIVAQDRLNRITQFVSEMSLTDCFPSATNLPDTMNDSDSPFKDCCTDWTASVIPVDSAVALTAAAAGIISDDDIRSPSGRWGSPSPEGGSTSEASENQSDGLERMNGICDNGHTPPELGTFVWQRSLTMERLESFDSVFSPVRSMASEDEEDEIFLSPEKQAGDEMIMEWARENKNDIIQIVCGYHAMPLPTRGSEIVFQPLEHLQGIEYRRPPVTALGLSERYLDQKFQHSLEGAEVNLKLAAGEEALALSIWTIATICRVLSLESVLALVAGVLLEKQVVVVCQNLGVLSAIVLSIIPMIRPFEWQSLFLPVLPGKMLDFLDAPVPFIVGVQHKPADWKMRTSNLVLINAVKDQSILLAVSKAGLGFYCIVPTSNLDYDSGISLEKGILLKVVKTCYVPALPRHKELIAELRPIHTKLSCQKEIARRHPVFKCNEVQAEAAAHFLTVMRRYLESLCTDLRSHTITSVQSNDRVSLLLKDSFVDSFPSKDQPFIKLFVDTQLFTVLSDSRLSSYENEY